MSVEENEERMEMAAGGENVGTDESEMMDQTHMVPPQLPPQIPPQIPPRIHNTSVIVSITGDRHSSLDESQSIDNDYISSSPSYSPLLQDPLVNQRLLMAKHLQVRQSLSEPSKARLQRPKQHRMSPIPKRHESGLSKTLSVGGLDGTTGIIGWRIGGDSSGPHSPTTMDSTHSSNESLNTNSSDGRNSTQHDTPTPTQSGNVTITKMPSLGGSPLQTSPAWILPTVTSTTTTPPPVTAGIIPTQEQLEALHQKQLEMLALLEQQKHLMASSGSKPELFQFPIALWPIGNSSLLTSPSATPSTTSTSATPSPTPSLSSTDSGFHSTTEGIPQHRPLCGSQSAPHGLKQGMSDTQYEALLKQFQIQHQHILLQQQQLYQHYLDQQHKLMQQAMLEKKHFEDQQRQLAGMHLQQQQQLQSQQSLLRQMQEQQLMQLQRQQQMIILQTLGIQQQHQAAVQAKAKTGVRRVIDKPDSMSMTYNSLSSQAGMEIDSGNLPKTSVMVHRSLSSTSDDGTSNGRISPNTAISPLGQDGHIITGGTGLVYDTMMLKHNCGCGSSHPEHPGRLQSIWARLLETGVVQRCTRLRARKASLAELQTLHSENHVRLYGRPNKLKTSQDKKDVAGMRAFVQISCGGVGVDTDTYWNDQHTSNAARMAVGSVIELADKIVNGEIMNGFALIRPPGHHALPNQAMAFCYFNNVAVAAKALVTKNKKVVIVDWDIHHGNGTQQIFYDNPSVLFISIHKFDNGTFFPGTGRPEEIGSGAGMGYNINIAFSGKQTFQGPTASSFGDAEYLAAFRSVVMPVIRDFGPDLILVSAGFNSTSGHPSTLGGYSVTPKCYAHLTRMLMRCGNGKVAVALEGGYELMSLCESAESCIKSLLGENLLPLDSGSVSRPPQSSAIACIEKTINCHKSYWSSLQQSVHLLNKSHVEAERCDDTITALACLSMSSGGGVHRTPSTTVSS